jgi:hypothetical protein
VEPKCCLCDATEGLSYCSVCKKHFCQACKVKYPARVVAMFLEAYKKLTQSYISKTT